MAYFLLEQEFFIEPDHTTVSQCSASDVLASERGEKSENLTYELFREMHGFQLKDVKGKIEDKCVDR